VAGTGELQGVAYSDGTPDVSYAYTRLGQPKTISDAAGTRTLTYDAGLRLTAETFNGSGIMPGKPLLILALKQATPGALWPGVSCELDGRQTRDRSLTSPIETLAATLSAAERESAGFRPLNRRQFWRGARPDDRSGGPMPARPVANACCERFIGLSVAAD
jgi:YD repeat-containing protein